MDGDALAQLAQLGAAEPLLELGLADQEHLEQLVAAPLEVREQPDLLEQLAVEILRLVEQQYGALALAVDREQVALELDQRLGLGGPGRQAEPEPQADLLEQLGAGERGVGDQRDVHPPLPLLEHVVERGGLAGADLAGDQHEGLAVLDPEAQVGERLLVLGAGEHEARLMPCDERVLTQAEMGFEHQVVRREGGASINPAAGAAGRRSRTGS